MADDKSKTGQPDRTRINRREPYEVDYWAKEFGVSKEQLMAAVEQVGVMVNDVRRYLGK